MEPALAVELPLRSIGKYQLIASLGRGGMGEVYLAVVAGPGAFNKLLVVKALRADELVDRQELTRMFLDEARLAARLNHPNIVQTYEVGDADGRHFIAMEFLEGQALRTLQRKLEGSTLALGDALRIITKTARGLHHAHELKGFNGESLDVVHRDVSPHNVFLTYDGHVKLLDFGIAKARDSEHLTKIGIIKGKLDYIAPEQLRGDKTDRRADVFSLGVIAWELITGCRFAGGAQIHESAKLQRRLSGREPKLRLVRPDVAPRLEAIIERALRLDPAERYADMAQFADTLESFLEEIGLRPRAKTLGDRLAELFHAERAQLGALTDRQLSLLRCAEGRGSARARIPDREPSLRRIGHSTSGAGREVGHLSLLSSKPPPLGLPAQPSFPSRVGLLARRPSRAQLAVTGAIIAASIVLALRSPGHVPRSASAPAAAIGIPASAVAPAPKLLTAAADEIAASAPPPPQRFQLRVEVLPPSADVRLDESALPSLPFAAELPRDGSTHHLEASAPGYASKRILVPFDRDRELKIVLQKLPSSSRRVAAPAAPRELVPVTTSPERAVPLLAASHELKPGERIELRRPRETDAVIDMTDPYRD